MTILRTASVVRFAFIDVVAGFAISVESESRPAGAFEGAGDVGANVGASSIASQALVVVCGENFLKCVMRRVKCCFDNIDDNNISIP